MSEFLSMSAFGVFLPPEIGIETEVKSIEAKLEGIKPELDIVGWSRWVVELFGYVTFRILVLAGGGVVWDSWRWSSRSRLAQRPTLMIKARVKGV